MIGYFEFIIIIVCVFFSLNYSLIREREINNEQKTDRERERAV